MHPFLPPPPWARRGSPGSAGASPPAGGRSPPAPPSGSAAARPRRLSRARGAPPPGTPRHGLAPADSGLSRLLLRRSVRLLAETPACFAAAPPPDRGGAAAPGGPCPPGPPDAGVGAVGGLVGWWLLRCGELVGLWWVRGFLGCGSSGIVVFWRSPNAAPWGGMGGAQRIREVGSATLLRLVAPPEVSAAHRLLARADAVLAPAAVPVRFLEPMGGESGDGGYGGTGVRGPGVGGCGGAQKFVGWGG